VSSSELLTLKEKNIPIRRDSIIVLHSHHRREIDFYTIGYAGRTITNFINTLKNKGISTVIDIRFLPLSRFRPEYSKKNLKRALEANGITYIHRPDWGVPSNIRSENSRTENKDRIWEWYDKFVLPAVVEGNANTLFISITQPVAFMCAEHKPKECHRHRIKIGLEQLGFRGRDL